MFTIESVSDLQWCNAEHTLFRCLVKYAEFGEILPVGVNASDPYSHIHTLWVDGTAGVYGPIAEYVPPPEPEEPDGPTNNPAQGVEDF